MSLTKVMALAFVFASLATQARATESLEEFNPFAPDAEQTLQEFDAIYEQETGLSPFLSDSSEEEGLWSNAVEGTNTCYRESCRVFIYISKADQVALLYVDGWPRGEWKVSTGRDGFETPDFNEHPNGRIYQRYTSTKYPEGDYKGLGNMPYAVFIRGGFALHGTPEGNWRNLGRRASHGCIRMHPDNAAYFNQVVRAVGVKQTWITVK